MCTEYLYYATDHGLTQHVAKPRFPLAFPATPSVARCVQLHRQRRDCAAQPAMRNERRQAPQPQAGELWQKTASAGRNEWHEASHERCSPVCLSVGACVAAPAALARQKRRASSSGTDRAVSSAYCTAGCAPRLHSYQRWSRGVTEPMGDATVSRAIGPAFGSALAPLESQPRKVRDPMCVSCCTVVSLAYAK